MASLYKFLTPVKTNVYTAYWVCFSYRDYAHKCRWHENISNHFSKAILFSIEEDAILYGNIISQFIESRGSSFDPQKCLKYNNSYTIIKDLVTYDGIKMVYGHSGNWLNDAATIVKSIEAFNLWKQSNISNMNQNRVDYLVKLLNSPYADVKRKNNVGCVMC